MSNHIELSELQTFLRCQRQHWYRYQMGLRGGRDTGYLRLHQAVYAAMSMAAEAWNQDRKTLPMEGDYLNSFINAWPEDAAVPLDTRDRYRRERAMPMLLAFQERVSQLQAQGHSVQLEVRPQHELTISLTDAEEHEATQARITWLVGHAEIGLDASVRKAYLHKFSRRKASHFVQADHFALTLISEAEPASAPGIWYPLLSAEPELVTINPKSAATARGKLQTAASGVLRARAKLLDDIIPPRCGDDGTCRSCAYRFNCFDGDNTGIF